MAIYHCSIKNIGRSGGRSIVAASAYRSAEILIDEETGIEHDFTNKHEVVYTMVNLPDNAPEAFKDRNVLWNEVERIEKSSDARFAREFEVAIPNELSLEQAKELIHSFAMELTKEGMITDENIHWKENNHHAHILATTRPFDKNGEWDLKEKKVYANTLDASGKAIYDPEQPTDKEHRIPILDKTGEQKVDSRNRLQWKRVTTKSNVWNKKEKIQEWRKLWETCCNEYLDEENKIDCRSYESQMEEDKTLIKIPTIHEGYAAREIEGRGGVADRCQINREIKKSNEEISGLQKEYDSLLDKMITWLKVDEESQRHPVKNFIGNWLEKHKEKKLQEEKIREHKFAMLEKAYELKNSKKTLGSSMNTDVSPRTEKPLTVEISQPKNISQPENLLSTLERQKMMNDIAKFERDNDINGIWDREELGGIDAKSGVDDATIRDTFMKYQGVKIRQKLNQNSPVQTKEEIQANVAAYRENRQETATQRAQREYQEKHNLKPKNNGPRPKL